MDKQNISSYEHYWQAYLETAGEHSSRDENYLVDQFGDNAHLADELGRLVVAGVKTATCSALWEWEAESTNLPEVGLKTIVLDGKGEPLCIIETTEVNIRPFAAVDAQFAYDEGEDDRSLESWRREHWKYFSRVLPAIGKEPISDMLVVCERFRVVYTTAEDC